MGRRQVTWREGRDVVLGAVLLASCASFEPRPMGEVPFPVRTQVQERGGLRVTTAVPTDEEIEAIFGVDLVEKRIQPVWVEVENGADQPFVFFEILADPEYFSAREAAYISHRRFAGGTNERIDDHFSSLGVTDLTFAPGETQSGFVFTNLDQGNKYVEIVLVGLDTYVQVPFSIPIPGFDTGRDAAELSQIYGPGDRVDFEDGEAFLEALADLPTTTSREDGTGAGAPLNVVLIGDFLDLQIAFNRRGWKGVEAVPAETSIRRVDGDDWIRPVDHAFALGRHQDGVVRKTKNELHQPNHLRWWLTPLRYRGLSVVLGSLSRDSELMGSARWDPRRNAIDPWVDEARSYLAQDLLLSSKVSALGLVPGLTPATADAPHFDLDGNPYWTDGARAVLVIGSEELALDELVIFDRRKLFDRVSGTE